MSQALMHEPMKYDVRPIKKRLLDFRDMERDIDNQIERLECLKAKMYSVGSPEMSDMPKGGGPVKDRIASNVAQKAELEEKIRGMIERRDTEKARLSRIIDNIGDPDKRAVIQMRYFDGEEWSSISRMLFGNRAGFDDREESFRRRTTKLHGRALVSLAACIDEATPAELTEQPQKASESDQ